MNIYYFNDAFHQAHYNCSSYSVDSIPLAQRQHIGTGVALIVFFFVCESLYIPCVVAIRRHLRESSCYKFMFFIGVVDVFCLLAGAFEQGIFAILGVGYCMAPTLNYIGGYIAHLSWRWESTAALCLALNRCIAMSSRYWAQILYEEYRAWLWVAGIAVFGLVYCALTPSPFFSPLYFAYLYNPHGGYRDDLEGYFHSVFHEAHNYLVLFGIIGLYIVFSLLLILKKRAVGEHTASQHKIFIQAAMISGLNAFTAAAYAYFSVFPEKVSPWLMKAATINWTLVHGMPAFIYLTMTGCE